MRSIAEYLLEIIGQVLLEARPAAPADIIVWPDQKAPCLLAIRTAEFAGIVIKRASGELGDIGVGAGHDDRAKIVTETRPKSHKLGHAVRVLHSCHVALLAASCFTRLGLWILPVGVRGSCAAVRKAKRAGTF